jgi:hypothetical protein
MKVFVKEICLVLASMLVRRSAEMKDSPEGQDAADMWKDIYRLASAIEARLASAVYSPKIQN